MVEFYLHKARADAKDRLSRIIADLKESEKIANGSACVYATGSFGRLEAGARSDLDVFIIIDTARRDNGELKSLLDGIDEIKIKYDLISVVEKNNIAKFDRGGEFLAGHTIDSYNEWLGSSQDDYRNTLTGRMLMLLESRPLVGEPTYHKAIEKVLDKYFRDYGGHEYNFMPAFLFNDILRMWRTFCVNYEFYRKEDSRDKIKNLKLKFSRMLTCFSGIIYLLAVFARGGTVRPEDVRAMVAVSPTERLEQIADKEFWGGKEVAQGIGATVREALDAYSEFLELTHLEAKKAVEGYQRDEEGWREKSYTFGESLSVLIDILGGMSRDAARLRRLIII